MQASSAACPPSSHRRAGTLGVRLPHDAVDYLLDCLLVLEQSAIKLPPARPLGPCPLPGRLAPLGPYPQTESKGVQQGRRDLVLYWRAVFYCNIYGSLVVGARRQSRVGGGGSGLGARCSMQAAQTQQPCLINVALAWLGLAWSCFGLQGLELRGSGTRRERARSRARR